jgi:hypothetical protein
MSSKGGRPPKPAGEKFVTPQRQLGRMSDEDYEELKAAAAQLGQPFSTWARGVLLRAAKRVLKEKGNKP